MYFRTVATDRPARLGHKRNPGLNYSEAEPGRQSYSRACGKPTVWLWPAEAVLQQSMCGTETAPAEISIARMRNPLFLYYSVDSFDTHVTCM